MKISHEQITPAVARRVPAMTMPQLLYWRQGWAVRLGEPEWKADSRDTDDLGTVEERRVTAGRRQAAARVSRRLGVGRLVTAVRRHVARQRRRQLAAGRPGLGVRRTRVRRQNVLDAARLSRDQQRRIVGLELQ